MVMLDHERLDVYQCSIEFLAIAFTIVRRIPRGHAPLIDQLRRAATSIPLNIAEAAGKTSTQERAHFHAIARGSAMECGAILDVVRLLRVADTEVSRGKDLLVRVVSMLSRMCR
jgi:four helix bundle protein